MHAVVQHVFHLQTFEMKCFCGQAEKLQFIYFILTTLPLLKIRHMIHWEAVKVLLKDSTHRVGTTGVEEYNVCSKIWTSRAAESLRTSVSPSMKIVVGDRGTTVCQPRAKTMWSYCDHLQAVAVCKATLMHEEAIKQQKDGVSLQSVWDWMESSWQLSAVGLG